jgi:hypothetical protein
MSNRDEPRDSASSKKEAESRDLRRLARALECNDMDELAAVRSQSTDPAWPAPRSHGRLKEK